MARTDQELINYALIGYQQEIRRIEEKIAEIRAQLGSSPATENNPVRESAAKKLDGRHNLSAAARERIAAAQKARWAAFRKEAAFDGKPKSAASAKTKS